MDKRHGSESLGGIAVTKPKTIITPAWVAKVPVLSWQESPQLRSVTYDRSVQPSVGNGWRTHRTSTGYAFRVAHLPYVAFVLSRKTKIANTDYPPMTAGWCLNVLYDDGTSWNLGDKSDLLAYWDQRERNTRAHQLACALRHLSAWDALRLDVFRHRSIIQRAVKLLSMP